ncbi:MAG: radical SAM protein [Deltaproteobacteria bacterium]|nr:radical SAM protein [Deltaproteobacteria bacterium]MBW2386161.1 radical SAM protein [Deltaproteobacteria bacterium]MBW2697013.1 radical SAM protein [Deltaproteobacteria bacterium]
MILLPPDLDDAAILAARGERAALDPSRPHGFFVEPEPVAGGAVEDVAAIFVTGAECPFRCLMCDLWKHTLERSASIPPVAGQVEWALQELPDAPHVKIYNAGSFFDSQAVTRADRARIAELVQGRERLIVECHPNLVDRRCAEFAAAIAPVRLEVAIGLETIDPLVLSHLNKGVSLSDFDRAARLLLEFGVALRAFILLGPPGHFGAESVDWASRSLDHALSQGASYAVVIPVRPGNGIVDQLERQCLFVRPTLTELAQVLVHGLESRDTSPQQRSDCCVLADLWDIEDFFDCPDCGPRRADALRRMNLTQRTLAAVKCRCQDPS